MSKANEKLGPSGTQHNHLSPQEEASKRLAEVQRLASLSLSGNSLSEESLEAVLSIQTPSATLTSGEWAQKELDFARAFAFDLPDHPAIALSRLQGIVCDCLDVGQCKLYPAVTLRSRSDSAYSRWLQADEPETRQLNRDLLDENGLVIGRLMLSEPSHSGPFTLKEQLALDLLIPYLTVQVQRLNRLLDQFSPLDFGEEESVRLSLLLTFSERLLTALEAEEIFPAALHCGFQYLGFETCQFIVPCGDEKSTPKGEILYEIRASGLQVGKVRSYSHAALEGKRRAVPEYQDWVSLILEQDPHEQHLLHVLDQNPSKSQSSQEGRQTSLLLPVHDLGSGTIHGLLRFISSLETPLSETRVSTAIEVARLTSRAYSRSLILEKALAMATSDELTGLMNRRGYYQRFEAEIERARRHQTPLSVALIDVDHFKRFNDTYGHLSGDLVLKCLAGQLAQNLRKSDVVCRFGGEEFAILLPDTPLSAAVDLLERVRQSVEAMAIQDFSGQLLQVTISSGLTEVDTRPHPGGLQDSEIAKALAMADEQLYRAKHEGRNQVMFSQKPSPAKAS